MKWLPLFFISMLACIGSAGTDSESTAYHVQLIRGTAENKPPEPNSKLLSAQEAGCFRSVFKWKSYWQISSQRVEILNGRSTRIRLNMEREVEIDLTRPEQRLV